MATLTIRLSDRVHTRLKEMALSRNVSMNKLMEELSSTAITEFDAETRFRAMAMRGSREAGLALLDKLDVAFAVKSEDV